MTDCMYRYLFSRLKADDIFKIVVIGASNGAASGLASAALGIPFAITMPIAAGTTGVIAASMLARWKQSEHR